MIHSKIKLAVSFSFASLYFHFHLEFWSFLGFAGHLELLFTFMRFKIFFHKN